MPSPVTIALYSDVHCPYAYLTVYRLRQLREEYRGRLTIAYKSLALEYVNRRSTPKPILDNETPILLLSEPVILFSCDNLVLPPNGLAFSCREGATRTCQHANDHARSGRLQCRVPVC
jgi:hypothetical protein